MNRDRTFLEEFPSEEPLGTLTITACSDDGDVKCPRCWRWHGVRDNYDHLCDRCQSAILNAHPGHVSVPGIKAARAAQRKRWSATLPFDRWADDGGAVTR